MTDPVLNIPPRDKAEILAQALPYIRKFHGKTIVIKYGGNAMTDPALQADFAEDVVLLKLVGMNPVVVHGGGPQIEAALNRLGKKGSFIQGMRVTDAETMEVVEWVLAGEVQQDIVGLINQAGGKAVGLTGRDGGLIRAQKLKMADRNDPNIEHDVGQVGDIVAIDPGVVKALQDDAFIPVVSPIGFGEENESYNINADVVLLARVIEVDHAQLLGADQAAVAPRQADRLAAGLVDQAHDVLLHLAGQHPLDDLHGLGVGHAHALDEMALLAEPVERRLDLRTAAVDHHGVHADQLEQHHVFRKVGLQGGVGHGIAAVLDDDGLAVEAPDVGQRMGQDLGLVARRDVAQVGRIRVRRGGHGQHSLVNRNAKL